MHKTRIAMSEADEIVRTHRARFDSATELFNDLVTLKKTATDTRTALPRAVFVCIKMILLPIL